MWTSCWRDFLLLCYIHQGNYYANSKKNIWIFVTDYDYFFYEKRDHASQTSYCNSHVMKLLTLESYAEEQAIQAAWGTSSECD